METTFLDHFRALIAPCGCVAGLDMSDEPIDAQLPCAKLKEVFGSGAEPLVRIIYERFASKLEAEQRIKFPTGTPVSECIIKTLEKSRASPRRP